MCVCVCARLDGAPLHLPHCCLCASHASYYQYQIVCDTSLHIVVSLDIIFSRFFSSLHGTNVLHHRFFGRLCRFNDWGLLSIPLHTITRFDFSVECCVNWKSWDSFCNSDGRSDKRVDDEFDWRQNYIHWWLPKWCIKCTSAFIPITTIQCRFISSILYILYL